MKHLFTIVVTATLAAFLFSCEPLEQFEQVHTAQGFEKMEISIMGVATENIDLMTLTFVEEHCEFLYDFSVRKGNRTLSERGTYSSMGGNMYLTPEKSHNHCYEAFYTDHSDELILEYPFGDETFQINFGKVELIPMNGKQPS